MCAFAQLRRACEVKLKTRQWDGRASVVIRLAVGFSPPLAAQELGKPVLQQYETRLQQPARVDGIGDCRLEVINMRACLAKGNAVCGSEPRPA
jgi:hypothetical protein